MAFEKQTKFDGVSFAVDWPDPPKATTVAGKEVILADDFNAWLRDLSLAVQNSFDSVAGQIESLKSPEK
jgi:hypothetical protein